METLLYLSIGFNVVLLLIVCFKPVKRAYMAARKAKTDKKAAPEIKKNTPKVTNEFLKKLAAECEAQLPEEDRGKIKLLIDTEHAQLAALQIGELRISLRRNERNQSLFRPLDFWDVLYLAKNGYNGTGRYVPVPHELDFILSQCRIINVYLKALKLEEISPEDAFWCVDVKTGWSTGWKRFEWNIAQAHAALSSKSEVRQHKGCSANKQGKLFLLLKGWNYMFVEV